MSAYASDDEESDNESHEIESEPDEDEEIVSKESSPIVNSNRTEADEDANAINSQEEEDSKSRLTSTAANQEEDNDNDSQQSKQRVEPVLNTAEAAQGDEKMDYENNEKTKAAEIHLDENDSDKIPEDLTADGKDQNDDQINGIAVQFYSKKNKIMIFKKIIQCFILSKI